MLAGVAVVPTAPVFVAGVSAAVPTGVAKTAAASAAAVRALPQADATVLVAAGDAQPGPVLTEAASLAGIGRPDLVRPMSVPRSALCAVVARLHVPVHERAELPLGLAVLALLTLDCAAPLPFTVAPGRSFDELAEIGAGLVTALADLRVVIVAAGDLSAGLGATAPLHLVPGAGAWDERALSVADSGRLGGLARLGPEEARRVGALGWGPLAVLHGALAAAKVGLVVRHYSAPLGVGYLVAQGG